MMKEISNIETKDKVGKTVELYGWVHNRRDHGKIIFIDLRDRAGLVQVVFTQKNKELYKIADSLRNEWVVFIKGKVGERPGGMINPDIPTGKIEIHPEELKVLSKSKTPPFEIDNDGYNIGEEHRLKYRYLDLRRERMKDNLILRHNFLKYIRDYFNSRGFIEVETPMLTKSTPEGSRDFVVPSRIYSGKFYALPQSPQQYKQLLMVAGLEKYYQIARVLRDEDPRADRGFEHTQIDIEMSFVEQKDVMNMTEEMYIQAIEKLGGKKITQKPFPVFSYKEAIDKFGDDKFDMRENKKDKNELAFAWVVDFPFFKKIDNVGKNGKSTWTFTHNPFSQPKPEYIKQHLAGKDLDKVITMQYDLVCNGYEVGGGSIRAYQPEILKATFRNMGYGEKEIKDSIGHMLEAFSYGVPSHGGIALGVDRLIMILAGEESIKEVIAFPMSGTGQTAVMDAPSELAKEQLKELHLEIKKKNK